MAADEKKPLSIREQVFVDEYFTNGFRLTAATVKAGYSPHSAGVQAQKLLQRPNVAAEIARRREAIETEYAVTHERVVRELALLGFSNMQDYMTVQEDGSAVLNLSNLTREQAAAIQQLDSEVYMERGEDDEALPVKKCKIRLHDKRGPLELLGKHVGVFKEDISRQVQVRIRYDGNNNQAQVDIGVKD